jgi:hypothetical protein
MSYEDKKEFLFRRTDLYFFGDAKGITLRAAL